MGLFDGHSDFICKPGDRLPNLRKGSFQLYDAVDRSRHFWVLINSDENSTRDNPVGKGGLKVIEMESINGEEQRGPPLIHERALKATQAILVRPDLYVTSIDTSMDVVWDRIEDLVGPVAQKCM